MNGDWVLLPVRSFEESKTRLSAVMSQDDRASLSARFFRHVLSASIEAVGAVRCAVITRSPDIRALAHAAGVFDIEERGIGLNAAAEQGCSALFAAGADRIVTLHCDLPLLLPSDIAALLKPAADIVLATDAAGSGTNALRMSRHSRIPLRYGEGSRAAHTAEADLRGLAIAHVTRRGLEHDVDLPSDLSVVLPT